MELELSQGNDAKFSKDQNIWTERNLIREGMERFTAPQVWEMTLSQKFTAVFAEYHSAGSRSWETWILHRVTSNSTCLPKQYNNF